MRDILILSSKNFSFLILFKINVYFLFKINFILFAELDREATSLLYQSNIFISRVHSRDAISETPEKIIQ